MICYRRVHHNQRLERHSNRPGLRRRFRLLPALDFCPLAGRGQADKAVLDHSHVAIDSLYYIACN